MRELPSKLSIGGISCQFHYVDKKKTKWVNYLTNMSTSELGFLAENLAARFLEKRGYKILDLNYRKPWGEIDIIASKEGILVFVEVKANRKIIAGFEPELRANRSKIDKVIRTARTYIAERQYDFEQEWQIDVISVGLDESTQSAKVKHFKNIDT